MIRVICFLPAILFTAFYGLVIIGTGLPIMPLVWVGIALFLLSGIFMCQRRPWAGLLGCVPGAYLVYMSTVDTGQIMNIELPLGLAVIAFYLVCGGCVFICNKKRPNRH